MGVQLLADIKAIFDGTQRWSEPIDAISSAELVSELVADAGSRVGRNLGAVSL